MSKKGCSPDNSACEGLFGRLKNEMFYNRKWEGVTLPDSWTFYMITSFGIMKSESKEHLVT